MNIIAPALARMLQAPAAALHVAARDELSRAHKQVLVLGIAGLHALIAWGLMQVPAVRQAALEAAPIFVNLMPPAAPPPTPPAPPPRKVIVPPRVPPVITSKPTPAPAPAFVVEAPPPEPLPLASIAPVEAPSPPVEPTVNTATRPPPKVIPTSGVQYVMPPPLEYPRISRRLGESGKVLVRVYIDEQGQPRTVQVNQSSGHARLDEAAVAAVKEARFKPYTEDGRPTPGWAFIPLTFDLER